MLILEIFEVCQQKKANNSSPLYLTDNKIRFKHPFILSILKHIESHTKKEKKRKNVSTSAMTVSENNFD